MSRFSVRDAHGIACATPHSFASFPFCNGFSGCILHLCCQCGGPVALMNEGRFLTFAVRQPHPVSCAAWQPSTRCSGSILDHRRCLLVGALGFSGFGLSVAIPLLAHWKKWTASRAIESSAACPHLEPCYALLRRGHTALVLALKGTPAGPTSDLRLQLSSTVAVLELGDLLPLSPHEHREAFSKNVDYTPG